MNLVGQLGCYLIGVLCVGGIIAAVLHGRNDG